jgi:SAM-dependent methyltransferase
MPESDQPTPGPPIGLAFSPVSDIARAIDREALAPIFPVMRKYGATCSPEEFHGLVNLAFHRAESPVYDRLHGCMWKTLPGQLELLVDDYTHAAGPHNDTPLALDVGCGTGLASDLLLRTRLGRCIAEVDLLDTSSEMLERAKRRARAWNAKARTFEGPVTILPDESRKYGIIAICSVLHHIPDLAAFLSHVQMLQADNGILIHLQDPNGDYLTDPVLKQRIAELKHYQSSGPRQLLDRLHPGRVIRRLRRELAAPGHPPSNYIGAVNAELVQSGVVREPMTALDIWTVTDIHVHDGNGISITRMSHLLDEYELISRRSYAFFGDMPSALPSCFRKREEDLTNGRAPNGMQLAGLWRRRCRSQRGWSPKR